MVHIGSVTVVFRFKLGLNKNVVKRSLAFFIVFYSIIDFMAKYRLTCDASLSHTRSVLNQNRVISSKRKKPFKNWL